MTTNDEQGLEMQMRLESLELIFNSISFYLCPTTANGYNIDKFQPFNATLHWTTVDRKGSRQQSYHNLVAVVRYLILFYFLIVFRNKSFNKYSGNLKIVDDVTSRRKVLSNDFSA